MPKMPASIADVLIVGVGDPRQGSFIDGRMSHQDASTLRQIAARLGGIYHDGNQKHIGTQLLNRLTVIPRKSAFEQLTRREYALIACGFGAFALALLPLLLHHFGTTWRPGVRATSLKARPDRDRPGEYRSLAGDRRGGKDRSRNACEQASG
jgi:Ca-activated chloride channel family protein